MCGIAGVVDPKVGTLDPGMVEYMTGAIHDISHDNKGDVPIAQGWQRDRESV